MPVYFKYGLRTGLLPIIAALTLFALASVTSAAENLIDVEEQFYRLSFNIDSGEYRRTLVNEARPGELLELQITATNRGNYTARNLDLINSVPTDNEDQSLLVADSFRVDQSLGEFRLSRNGETFFPAGVEMEAKDIRFVQWLIFSLSPGEHVEFSYRLSIPH